MERGVEPGTDVEDLTEEEGVRGTSEGSSDTDLFIGHGPNQGRTRSSDMSPVGPGDPLTPSDLRYEGWRVRVCGNGLWVLGCVWTRVGVFYGSSLRKGRPTLLGRCIH